jgi:hypothetical protein
VAEQKQKKRIVLVLTTALTWPSTLERESEREKGEKKTGIKENDDGFRRRRKFSAREQIY